MKIQINGYDMKKRRAAKNQNLIILYTEDYNRKKDSLKVIPLH